jgi:hypothetical protein
MTGLDPGFEQIVSDLGLDESGQAHPVVHAVGLGDVIDKPAVAGEPAFVDKAETAVEPEDLQAPDDNDGSGALDKADQLADAVLKTNQARTGQDGVEYLIAKRPDAGGLAKPLTVKEMLRAAKAIKMRVSTAQCKKAKDYVAAEALDNLVELALRVHESPGRIVIDLGQAGNERCVVITPDSWQVLEYPPPGVYFVRTNTQPLPDPQTGGSLDLLHEVLDLPEDDAGLVDGWLVMAVRPGLPRPLIYLAGPQGSAKTTRGAIIASVLDPPPGRSMGSALGKKLSDDQLMAHSRYLVTFDNISKVNIDTSDYIARLVTGDAVNKRRLYTDSDMINLTYRRTGIITGINVPAGLGVDALERLIVIDLIRIDPGQRRTEAEVWANFEDRHPQILGALCDAVAKVLASERDTTIDLDGPAPRMADYHRGLVHLDPALAHAYAERSQRAIHDAAAQDPFVHALVRWLRHTDNRFQGTPTQAYTSFANVSGDTDSRRHKDASWPKDAAAFSRALNNKTETLRSVGITLTHHRGRQRQIALELEPEA